MEQSAKMTTLPSAKRRRAAAAALAAVLALAACSRPNEDLTAGESGRVSTAEDGDTLILDDGLRVHLAEVDGPRRDWPRAADAQAALEKLAVGRRATLRYGGARRLEDGSAVAHVFIETEGGRTLWAQEELVRDGWARVHSRKDNRTRVAQLLEIESKARVARRGLWSEPFYAVEPADAVGEVDRFAIVEGRVQTAEARGDRTFLNFGEDYRSDFTVAIGSQDLTAFTGAKAPDALVGSMVRVRGYLRESGGPLMRIDHAEQIEIVPTGDVSRR
jgi:endonuclease YncB( thermonuclease family)